VLKDLGFIDDGSRVELKGKVACEVLHHTTFRTKHANTILDSLCRRARPNRTGPRERACRLYA
jgi:hypothetical protein